VLSPIDKPAPELRVVSAVPTITPEPTPFGELAAFVGILGGTGTTVTMIPADLMNGYRADITDFAVTIDAGIY
jgi:hypothetical protein